MKQMSIIKPVNFGILGCGQIGSRHTDKITQLPNMKLVAVCDTDPLKAIELGQKYHCPSYTDINCFLKNPDIDFVNICTPSGLHAEHTIYCLKNGKHVLCEKPMALSSADAEKMVNTAKKYQRHLFVVKQNRYNPPVQYVNQLIKDHQLGKPLFCSVNVFWNRNDQYYQSSPWRGTLNLDGGTIYTQASHFVDLMLLFMGEASDVKATMATLNHKIEIEDTGVINLIFKSGALGSFNYTTCSYNKNFEGSISLFFTKGTIKIGGEYLNTLEYFQVEGLMPPKLNLADSKPNDYGTYKGSMSNHHEVFKDLVSVFNHQKTPANLVDGFEGIGTIKLIEQAIRSAKQTIPQKDA